MRSQFDPFCKSFRNFTSNYDWDSPERILIAVIYNVLTCVPIDDNAQLTMETQLQADSLWDMWIGPLMRGYKQEEKRQFFRRIVYSAKYAMSIQGCFRFSRDVHRKESSFARQQVIDAAVKIGLLYEVRSPKGSPKMSRYIPTGQFRKFACEDPWDFDAERMKRFVYLRRRGVNDQNLWIDPDNLTAKLYQEKLERINTVNNDYVISCERFSVLNNSHLPRSRLRPVFYAVFTDPFDLHGRLYTGKYGHQSLDRQERKTIQFGNEKSVELDYSGLHCRMLYNLEKIDFRDDPYKLWGSGTPDDLRKLAKLVVNTAINANTPESAIASCNYCLS